MKVQGGRMVPVQPNTADLAGRKRVDEQVKTSLQALRQAQGTLRDLFSMQGAAAGDANLSAVWRALEQAENALKVASERSFQALSR